MRLFLLFRFFKKKKKCKEILKMNQFQSWTLTHSAGKYILAKTKTKTKPESTPKQLLLWHFKSAKVVVNIYQLQYIQNESQSRQWHLARAYVCLTTALFQFQLESPHSSSPACPDVREMGTLRY